MDVRATADSAISATPQKNKGRCRWPPNVFPRSEVRRPLYAGAGPLAALRPPRLEIRLDHLLHSVIRLHRRHDLGQFLAFDDHLDLSRVQHFAFDQRQRDPDQNTRFASSKSLEVS